MTTKRKFAILTTAAAMLVLSGCYKMTGGGWFLDGDGDMVTFGFNARPDGEATGYCDGHPFPFPQVPTCQPAKGRLTLIDHGNASGEPHMIKGEFTGTYNPGSGSPGDGSQFAGTVTVDGEDWLLGMRVTDAGEPGVPGDFVFIMLEPVATADGSPDLVYIGEIAHGNIQVHAK